MGIYELVPYWEPQYVKCQAEAIQQTQPQAEATLQSTSTSAGNVFQSLKQVLELTFSVQACIPYISIALMAILLGLCVLLMKGCTLMENMGEKECRLFKSVQVFVFVPVSVKSRNDFGH
ncbi:hypothetical protein GXP67_16180 [Rhodocytophaga rosea]|uniref:Uncharacterized protein n=1 Tax=Rhodocytophaga rosea TaxID=2704465 RepID=A0A6C0GJE9_9BACT|nr:hypothetical protein [Rhodocytophaga rosea]QHT68067.1 hypothetical protein GXP67_16180 [Rhodocytophaga rosea]